MKRKYRSFVLAFFVSLPLCIIMSLIGIVNSVGFIDGWLKTWMKSFMFMMPVAYVSAIIFSSLAQKLTERIHWTD